MSHTLLLNKDYTPISVLPLSVIHWQHAIKLMYLGRIQVIETYPDWIIHSEKLAINVPSVAMTREYFNFKRRVNFTRYNMYLRDLYQCQYCLDTFDFDDLTIDHVVPVSQGGKTEWTNCVTSCKACNWTKADQAVMQPTRKPYRPDYWALAAAWKHSPFRVKDPKWNQYLGRDRAAA
jgi:5-methylcytosine-specific restriction endonuclease McrA